MSGTFSCAGVSVSETGTNCPAFADLGAVVSRANCRQRCTTLALMPRAIATLATDAPPSSHSASTCNLCSSLYRRREAGFSLPIMSTYFLCGHDPLQDHGVIQDGIATRLRSKEFAHRYNSSLAVGEFIDFS